MGFTRHAVGIFLLFVLSVLVLEGHAQFLRDDAENPRVDQGLVFQLKTLLEKQDKLMDKQESRLEEQDKRISLLENYVVDMHRDIQFLSDFVRTYVNDSSAEVSSGPSVGPTPAPRFQPNDKFIDKISGTWTFLYSDGIEGKFNISKTGLITLIGEKDWGEVYMAPSNNEENFPSYDGWLMAATSFRGDNSWEYYRLNKDGTLEMQSIWKDGCKAKVPRCFSGTGVKEVPKEISDAQAHLADLIKEMAGNWILSYADGFNGQFIISSTGSVLLKGREDWEVYLIPSNNQKFFPSKKGWVMAKNTFRGDGSWDYYRLNEDGTLAIESFWKYNCDVRFKDLEDYCHPGRGVKVPLNPPKHILASVGLIGKMSGTWKIKYPTGYETQFTISKLGKILLKPNKAARRRGQKLQIYLLPTDNQELFPSAKGWFMAERTFRGNNSWDYYRLDSEGRLQINSFWKEGCTKNYTDAQKTLTHFCDHGVGFRVQPKPIQRNPPDPDILANITGTWSLLYSDGFEGKLNITAKGRIFLENREYTDARLSRSNNQDAFPSNEGWVMAEVTFRGEHSWDYYRLKQDGTLEIEAFWKDICKSRFKDLEHYCFSGIGVEVLPLAMKEDSSTLDEAIAPVGDSKSPKQLIGVWKQTHPDGFISQINIFSERLSNRNYTIFVTSSTNLKSSPTSETWKMVENYNAHTAWGEKFGINNGTLNINFFRKETCKNCEDLEKYCYPGGIRRNVSYDVIRSESQPDPIPAPAKLINKLVGTWIISYDNGYEGKIAILATGKAMIPHQGMMIDIFSSDNEAAFPTLEGWVMGSESYRGKGSREYYRLSNDGKIEIQSFGKDCKAIYKGVKNYCGVGTGKKALEKPLSVLLNELVGPWTLKYKDGFEGHVTVSTTGKVKLKGRKDWEVYIQPSNNEKVFQSIKGWVMVKKTFRGEDSWDYYRLTKNGTLEIQAFWKEGCSLHYKNEVENYCFSGNGFRGHAKRNESASTSNILSKMEGTWTLTYSDGFEGHIKIFKTGKMELKQREDWNVKLIASDNQDVFPTAQGWVRSTLTFRGDNSWDYFRLTNENSIEIHAFWEENCDYKYKGAPHYCFAGKGLRGQLKRLEPSKKEAREKFTGEWMIYDDTGYQIKLVISREGKITVDGRQDWSTMLERSNDQRIFPTSEGYYMAQKTFRDDNSWEYYRINTTDGTMEVHTFWPYGCYDNYKRLRYYCMPSKGVKVGGKLPGGLVKPLSTDEIREFAGQWLIKDSYGILGRFTIASNGDISMQARHGWLAHLTRTDNEVEFPASQGWLMAKTTYRGPNSWEYYRLLGNGSLDVQPFWKDGCYSKYRHLQHYCTPAIGERIGSANADPSQNSIAHSPIDQQMERFVGQWSLQDSDGFTGDFEISPNGIITIEGRSDWVTQLTQSDNPQIFPPSHDWFLAKATFRGEGSWDYYRLTGDDILEYYSFWRGGCFSTYHGLQHFCVSGTGQKY